MIKGMYENEIGHICKEKGNKPDQMRVELVACFERLLCYCHTGNAAVLATSLMHPLGLSMGILKDGFPTLMPLFQQGCVFKAAKDGYKISPRLWPCKNGYPAVASKRCQVLTYSEKHFLVSKHHT